MNLKKYKNFRFTAMSHSDITTLSTCIQHLISDRDYFLRCLEETEVCLANTQKALGILVTRETELSESEGDLIDGHLENIAFSDFLAEDEMMRKLSRLAIDEEMMGWIEENLVDPDFDIAPDFDDYDGRIFSA